MCLCLVCLSLQQLPSVLCHLPCCCPALLSQMLLPCALCTGSNICNTIYSCTTLSVQCQPCLANCVHPDVASLFQASFTQRLSHKLRSCRKSCAVAVQHLLIAPCSSQLRDESSPLPLQQGMCVTRIKGMCV